MVYYTAIVVSISDEIWSIFKKKFQWDLTVNYDISDDANDEEMLGLHVYFSLNV